MASLRTTNLCFLALHQLLRDIKSHELLNYPAFASRYQDGMELIIQASLPRWKHSQQVSLHYWKHSQLFDWMGNMDVDQVFGLHYDHAQDLTQCLDMPSNRKEFLAELIDWVDGFHPIELVLRMALDQLIQDVKRLTEEKIMVRERRTDRVHVLYFLSDGMRQFQLEGFFTSHYSLDWASPRKT